MNPIVEALKAAQEAANLSSGEVARRIQGSPSTMSRYRSGDVIPSLEVARAWAEACGARLTVVRPLVAEAQEIAELAEDLTLEELERLRGVARALKASRGDPAARAVVFAATEMAADRWQPNHLAVVRHG